MWSGCILALFEPVSPNLGTIQVMSKEDFWLLVQTRKVTWKKWVYFRNWKLMSIYLATRDCSYPSSGIRSFSASNRFGFYTNDDSEQ